MSFKRISIEQAKALIQSGNPAIVDVRDPASYQAGHIENAVLLDNHSVRDFIADTSSDTPVLVYCYHGNSSQGAARFLAEQGFEEVYSVDGGYEVWKTQL